MAIRFFAYFLLFGAVFSLFIGVESDLKDSKKYQKPLITFIDSTMTSIDEQKVTQVVQSKEARMYKNKEELYDATIVTRANQYEADDTTDTIVAKKMVKRVNDLRLSGNVLYQRNGTISLRTDKLRYNLESKIAKNNTAFTAVYNGNKLDGKNLYFDGISSYFSADNTNFEILIKDKK